MIAIIPARGGSKGLPGKNLRLFSGKPLIVHSIEQAKKCKHITRVIVSTDDEAIAEVAKAHGAEVPFMRPSALASDDSPALDTYFYSIDKLNEDENITYSDFIVLLPTAPLRAVKHLNEAIELFYEKKADSVISITESPVPIEWTRKIDDKGILVPYFDDGNKNRQEYRITYVPNGQIYIFNYQALKASGHYYMQATYPYITDGAYYGDIDDINDFELTEFKFNKLLEKGMLE